MADYSGSYIENNVGVLAVYIIARMLQGVCKFTTVSGLKSIVTIFFFAGIRNSSIEFWQLSITYRSCAVVVRNPLRHAEKTGTE